jgi:hypothetical protein
LLGEQRDQRLNRAFGHSDTLRDLRGRQPPTSRSEDLEDRGIDLGPDATLDVAAVDLDEDM